eukprot:CAMPEP_0206140088 /NCGR_PEP_ID=MMETSP1473-20131121/8292_1 /ASSEMBLY_ACC=CAM_ASM_001109 /TAXON_ID=1461547 /ORGANISM="Stichococcus sp, Strain RCC1054" /LENGTH=427 /DNA_ID=CAMNT_0053534099 /DNA_START=327 /DNA_END=1614 /DNA_ORIENTATION=+
MADLNHLQHYSSPVFQRYIVRIIFMVPVYAVCSFLALVLPHKAVYFDTVRVIYEAFVIYTFLNLCLGYVGGAGEVEVKMNGFVLQPSWMACTCCLPPQMVNGHFVKQCKQGALQFVLLMPILGIASVILFATGNYTPGNWGPKNGYLYITIVYNITYSVALFALFVFYKGAHTLLAPFNPMLKFLLVKSVVFFTFWQGILIAILVGTDVIEEAEDGANLQNLLICLEMLPASLAMFYAFPYTEYKEEGAARGGPAVGNAMHAISIHDVASDTVHQFAPTYRDYVLYSDSNVDGDGDGDGTEQPKVVKTFRAKTFVPVEEVAKVTEKPNASLLSNMEMGNAAGWANGSSDAVEPLAGPAASNGPGQPQNGQPREEGTPDLTFINSESVAASQPADPAPPPPQQQQQPQQQPGQQGTATSPPAWADVDL